MSKNKKICPLTYGTSKGAYDQEIGDFDYCVKESCAWWDEHYGCCPIKLIGESITGIARATR